MILYQVLFLSFCGFCWAAEADDGPIVTTEHGQVRGLHSVDNHDRKYDEFLGVPFGKPPVEDLRWRKSEPVEAWDGVWNATEHAPNCIQIITILYSLLGMRGEESEDCLYLNVYVPDSVEEHKDNPLPVMVWIYGGGFMIGAAEMYPGEGLALDGKVVVVTVNYRIGVLGFLSTGDDFAPGNYGLFDIGLAVQWVHNNIANFNGDPERVTLFGQSAGGFSVSYSMMSPLTEGLFQRAIPMSGGTYADLSGRKDPARQAAFNLGNVTGCTRESTQDMMECMREVDGTLINLMGTLSVPGPWSVVVDGEFLTKNPSESWDQGAPKRYDFLGGSTDHDSAGFVLLNPIALPGINYSLSSTNTLNGTLALVYNSFASGANEPDEVLRELCTRYPGFDSEDIAKRTLAVSLMQTQQSFGSGMAQEADIHSSYTGEKGSTYLYIYEHRNSFLIGYPPWVNGSHIDDIYSVLGDPFMKVYRDNFLEEDFNEADISVKDGVTKYYANFAYTGNPNEGPHEVRVEWPEYDTTSRNMLYQSTDMRAQNLEKELQENYHFWRSSYPDMLSSPDDLNSHTEILNAEMKGVLKRLLGIGGGSLTKDDVMLALQEVTDKHQQDTESVWTRSSRGRSYCDDYIESSDAKKPAFMTSVFVTCFAGSVWHYLTKW